MTSSSSSSSSSSTAIVTGGSRGLGRGIAAALAAEGHRTILVARDPHDLAVAAEAIAGDVVAERLDVADEGAVDALIARVGTIDVLVNAAGAPPVLKTPDRMSWQEWRRPIDVDVRGVFNLARAAAPALVDGATVVNVASGAVVAGTPLHASYAAGQSALLSLSRSLGAWLAPRGVATHCLAPSLTLAGAAGRAGATTFGAPAGLTAEEWFTRRFGSEMLTAEQTGAAVVTLTAEREGGDWVLGSFGLHRWSPLVAPEVTDWSGPRVATG
ncbi:FabG-like 3-oxoacyl-(acyl-carrier-protein) reductase [Baekduia alba]|uniref:SDR family NAD(P)-dependent oxidoreductase n=1 Tax=Baekduia alba TaxID=2997333 RepID=UPI0023405290|nr:SDR family oxidoreductase [Baekduia alba]WCB92216.1 FabG-like 3-oxoacyl-(acyl-carrier-protein) reductase [Baekduia alba]